MPRLKNKLPSYCLHKASGQAVVWFGGREHYLGKYGSVPFKLGLRFHHTGAGH